MKTDHALANSPTKPTGWPFWLWWLVRLSVAPEHRFALVHPSQLAQTARALADRLQAVRADSNDWRERAFSAEKIVLQELMPALKAACQRHDEAHSTMLGWKIF